MGPAQSQAPSVPTNGARTPHSPPLLPERIVSYAQTGEDVVLARAFAHQRQGFYIDVGACDPAIDSVTLHFYGHGWHGVNIEPDRQLFAAFPVARERDTNICAAIGRTRGKSEFFATGTRGHGTLSSELASDRTTGRAPERVPVMTLNDVFDCYGPDDGVVDFLKIDVEGSEADVIVATDWTLHRPRVILVEAVDTSGRPTHWEWEPVLLAAGYVFTLFDGLNRFYCRTEDEALIAALSVPANPIDDWIRAEEVRAVTAAADARGQLGTLHVERTELLDRITALTAEVEAARAAESLAGERLQALTGAEAAARDRGDALAVDVLRAHSETAAAVRREEAAREQLVSTERELWRVKIELEALRDEREREARERTNLLVTLAETIAARHEAQAAIAALRATLSWRLTAPLRVAARIARAAKLGRPATLDRLMRRVLR